MIFLLFIFVPAVELALLIQVGRWIGTLETLGIIAVTGIVGASLARHQGLRVLRQLEKELGDGRLPGAALVDGLIILVAGALLITPGLLTDLAGFLCLLPGTRGLIRNALVRRFTERVRRGQAQFVVHVGDVERHHPGGPVYDVTEESRRLSEEQRQRDEDR